MDNREQVLASQLEYLSLSKPQRAIYKISHFFLDLPKKISDSFRRIPSKTRKVKQSAEGVFSSIYHAGKEGDYKTRISFILMGFGLMTRNQILRGSFYFLYELFFIVFMCLIGGTSLASLPYLGQIGRVTYTVIDPDFLIDIETTVYYDNSFTIFLFSTITFILILILIFLWYNQLKDSLKLQRMNYIGKKASDKESFKNIFDKSYEKTLLFLPMSGLVLFTVIPIIIMILVGFTNYNSEHMTPTSLFDWVGLYNFEELFASGSASNNNIFLEVFGQVLLWTLVWAFFATFSNYFLGMIMAMIINIKGIKLKKIWRTVLISTIAVPQFISLLLVSYIFSDYGVVNGILTSLGLVTGRGIPFLSDALLAKVMIILINTWVGIPYTMLICSGLLMNIPDDLYESARIDGASPLKMYIKITLPYMLFVTTPYLISQFVGNINNFNVIYLLTSGGPAFSYPVADVPYQVSSTGVGHTDLLITWIYKMTVTSNSKDYGAASVIGLLIFAVVAVISLIFYNRSNSVKNEEEFQ